MSTRYHFKNNKTSSLCPSCWYNTMKTYVVILQNLHVDCVSLWSLRRKVGIFFVYCTSSGSEIKLIIRRNIPLTFLSMYCQLCCFTWYSQMRECLHFLVRHGVTNASCLYCGERMPTPQLLCILLLHQNKELQEQSSWSHNLLVSPCFSLAPRGCSLLCLWEIRCKHKIQKFLSSSAKIANREEPQKQSREGILQCPQVWIFVKLTTNEFSITGIIQI